MELLTNQLIDFGFGEIGVQTPQQIRQNLYMDLMIVPPSQIEKQQKLQQTQSINNHTKSCSGFYSKVINVSQQKRKTINLTEDTKYLLTQEGSVEKEHNQQRSLQQSQQSHSLYNLLLQKEQQIDVLQQKYVQQRNVSSKQLNKQGINFMTGYPDRALDSLRGMLKWTSISKEQRDVLQEFVQDTIEFVNSLNEIFRVQQHHVQLCQHRLTQSELILKQAEQSKFEQPDVFNLRKMMSNLLESLTSQQSQELNAVCLFRDLQRANLQLSSLQSHFDKVQQKSKHQEQSVDHYKKNFQYSNEENLVFKKNLRKERDQNYQNVRRVNTLEQRLEVLQGQDNHKQDQDALRNIIDDMIKENEQNKRKAFSKSQEVIKQEQQINELKDRTNKLTRRNYALEKQLKAFGVNSHDLNSTNGIFQNSSHKIPTSEQSLCEDDIEDMKPKNVWDDVFERGIPPRKLDYKFESLKSEYKNVLQDVVSFGPKSTWDQIAEMKDPNEKINRIMLFMEYFVQFKFLAEKLNTLIKFIADSATDETIDQLMQHVAEQLPAILQCEQTHLWLIDQSTATFYTLSPKRIHALIDADYFYALVSSQKISYAHSTIVDGKVELVHMYKDADSNQSKLVKDCLLIPIMFEGRLIGLLSSYNFPEQPNIVQNATYLAILTSFLTSRFLMKINQLKQINYKLKYKSILYETMLDLSKQDDLYSFQKAVQKHAETLFGVTSTIFYYFHQHQLVSYSSPKDQISYSSNLGVAGLAAKTQRTILANNISQHQAFHMRVDLESALPVFVIPLVETINKHEASKILNESQDEGESITLTIAVLEINLNQRAKVLMGGKQFDLNQFVGPSDTLQSMALMFSQIVSLSYKIYLRNS